MAHPNGLKYFMKLHKLTNQTLADRIKVKPRTIEGWRHGRTINALSMCAIKMFWGE
jgi:transcriptional regulator with XRE-family HTH domain